MKTPGVVGGRARLYNKRIPVWQIVLLVRLGRSPQELDAAFEDLPEDAYRNAMLYYLDHQAEIELDIAENNVDDPE